MRCVISPLVLAAITLAGPAFADVVHLKNGKIIEGRSQHTPKGLEIEHRFGKVLVPHDEVDRVVQKETPGEVYAKRLAKLAAGDLQGTLALAAYCLDADLKPEATALLLERAQPLDPKSPKLHALMRRLDYHLVKGKWLPPRVYYPLQGYERIDGKWLPPVRARVVRASRALKAREQDVEARAKDLSYAETGLRSANSRLDWAEGRLEELLADQVAIAGRVQAAQVDLRAREQDLQFARARLLDAERRCDAWRVSLCACRRDDPHAIHGDGCRWGWRFTNLRNEVVQAERAALAAQAARDQAAECVKDRLRYEASLPGEIIEQRQRIAKAKANVPRAEEQLRAAQRNRQAALDALQAARKELADARAARAKAANAG